MKEIRFRALQKKEKERSHKAGKGWLYFDLYYLWNSAKFCLPIDWDTIGQYNGLKDKKGNGIYEGDIMEYFFDHGTGPIKKYYVVKIKDLGSFTIFHGQSSRDMLIVGNKYEHPGLLNLC